MGGITRGTTGLLFFCFFIGGTLHAQGVRDRTRPETARDTAISETQAIDLTLTLTETTRRTLQTWVRTAGSVDTRGRALRTYVKDPEAELIRIGQRVRAFPPESISSVYQARVTRIDRQGDGVMVQASIASDERQSGRHYVMEILADRGEFLSVPNEAIIEEDGTQTVYLQMHPGHFVPQEIQTGLVGELYTEIRSGLEEGQQVVTFGSFFIDAEHKLNSGQQDTMGNAHHNH